MHVASILTSEQRDTIYSTEDARWQAVIQRDQRADGVFLYGVTTTGVFCRPGCASRLPHREHVRFFANCDDAEQAGFRACKRCAPRASVAHEAQLALAAKACALIDKAETPPTLSALAAAVGLSPFHFQRLFKRVVGVSPKQYALGRRTRAQQNLHQSDTITQAVYDSGFGSSSRFYEESQRTLGMTATAYRAGGVGQQITFATTRSYLGWVLVATTERGICAIELGDTPQELEQKLRARFPEASITLGTSLEHTLASVVALLEAPARGLDLPLDVQGTAFQRRVWAALRDIPAGRTVTYAQLAERIGSPKAARAVAQACGANPVAVAIPCHRVVGSDGGLAGYHWGIERKQALLSKEQAGWADEQISG